MQAPSNTGEFVALIPDGNRSWEKEFAGVSVLQRHHLEEAYEHGVDAVKQVISLMRDEHAKAFFAWGLSTKNLDARGGMQLEVLFGIFRKFLLELRDEWMDKPENKNVRYVHMGREDRLQEQAPELMNLIREVSEHTRNRTGMALLIGLDYDGIDEAKRARKLWLQEGQPYGSEGFKLFLDFPRQVEWMRELNADDDLKYPLNLLMRTKTAGTSQFHDNECLHEYRRETRVDLESLKVYLPDFTAQMAREALMRYRTGVKKMGA